MMVAKPPAASAESVYSFGWLATVSRSSIFTAVIAGILSAPYTIQLHIMYIDELQVHIATSTELRRLQRVPRGSSGAA